MPSYLQDFAFIFLRSINFIRVQLFCIIELIYYIDNFEFIGLFGIEYHWFIAACCLRLLWVGYFLARGVRVVKNFRLALFWRLWIDLSRVNLKKFDFIIDLFLFIVDVKFIQFFVGSIFTIHVQLLIIEAGIIVFIFVISLNFLVRFGFVDLIQLSVENITN